MGDITSPNGVWSQGVFTAKDGTKYEGERAVLADAPSLGDLLRGLFGGAKPAGNVPLPPKRPAGLGAKPAALVFDHLRSIGSGSRHGCGLSPKD